MADHIKGFTVALEADLHEEDFARVKEAVLMIKGVVAVESSVSTSADWINRAQVSHEMQTAIYELCRKKREP